MAHIPTGSEIRQSFLDFFREKQHTIVPSSSLMPDSPNLLFTNAGMNQFVPIFLGKAKADLSRWPGAAAGLDTRAADTQKCIRAGGKHNDLEDVGLDTYHHTFFEMLGNWSFGDYFKKEAIDWAWELLVERWKFPASRLYATVYSPGEGDPSEFDQEAWDHWAVHFRAAGLDPQVHIVPGNKKDNFWMMGDTGPCGPCSEIHIDITPQGDTRGALVNKGTAECIEIWNLVFIQFNANPDGTFTALPARHVDTGMGFERVCSVVQGTKGFIEFSNAHVSNYETDVFRPLFAGIEKLSGKTYGSTLPEAGSSGQSEQEKIDIAFRVIADHARTLSFAVADGITPGNNDRNYVLRRILRRAVRYGRTLGFHEPFFYQLTGVLAQTMGDVFPELRDKQAHVEQVLRGEEEAFNRTLDKGIALFEAEADRVGVKGEISGAFAFRLYDEQGFPLDLTELMARERGLSVDTAGFEKLMEEQRTRARAAQKKQVITVSEISTKEPTRFIGYDNMSVTAKVSEIVDLKGKLAVVLDASTCYAEMGGQVGDTGELRSGSNLWRIANTQKAGDVWLHVLEGDDAPEVGKEVELCVDVSRRAAIQRHHTVTHLLHWALHEVVSREATQKGSYVGPDKLTFDFSSAALTPEQVAAVERLVNEKILENAPVSWNEVAYADVRGRGDVMQFFGDKYGDRVRVVQIGGKAGALDGYSMELCGGTQVRGTGEIGLFRITGEGAVAAGIRRIEAVAGEEARRAAESDRGRLKSVAAKLGSPLADLEKKLDAFLAQQKETEKSLKSARQREAASVAAELAGKAETINGIPAVFAELAGADGDALQAAADALKAKFRGVIVLGGVAGGAVSLVAAVGKEHSAKVSAGKIIQTIAPLVGGKGGGKPDNARGGGKDASKLADALNAARDFIANV
ncbi:MAG: alanine--tRNA ligase [Chthoniobacterales bacterium]|nr:alanine--tRNA ligase [Chthoniobacterales bacterium]